MKNVLRMVAVVFALFMFALPAQAQDAPLWHCDAVTVAQASAGPGYNVTATGAGAYWRIKQVGGSTVAGPQTSPVFVNVSLVEGTQYQAQAADSASGPWSNNPACLFTVAPLSVVIDGFAVACEPGGVRLEWSVSTEAFVTRYSIAKDGALFLDVPSDCPGCTPGAVRALRGNRNAKRHLCATGIQWRHPGRHVRGDAGRLQRTNGFALEFVHGCANNDIWLHLREPQVGVQRQATAAIMSPAKTIMQCVSVAMLATLTANKETMMKTTLDTFGRRYLALETDSPERWEKFATSHPKYKPANTENPSVKES